MSLNHVILGLLKREPMTGYDMKKIMQNTPFLYWSGNNNQIYKAFVELMKEGLVRKEVEHQEGAPSKNIYTITKEGQQELQCWLLGESEAPTMKKQFLIKLALIDQLEEKELLELLQIYEEEVRTRLIVAEQEFDRCYFVGKQDRDFVFGDLIRENIVSFYGQELAWLDKVKKYVVSMRKKSEENAQSGNHAKQKTESVKQKERKEEVKMKYQVKESDGKRYLYLEGNEPLITQEQDALDIIALCWEKEVNAILMEGTSLSEEFIRLRTGLAGAVIQKLANYNMKLAIVINEAQTFPERFKEMASEYSKGNLFRIFLSAEEALNWLL